MSQNSPNELPPEGLPSEELPPDKPIAAPRQPPNMALRVLAFVSGFIGLVIVVILFYYAR
ncbi:hypothetical protein BH09VER1_BH09VER1_46110 [soil metagenome]